MTLSLTSCFIVINHKEDEPKQTDAPAPSSETEEKETKPPAQTFAPQTDALSRGESEAEELMSSYLDSEYEGKLVITLVGDYVSLLTNSGTGTFSRAMGIRNDLISQAFKCEIEVRKKDYATFYEEAVSAKNAGLSYSDIVIVPYSKLGEMWRQDLISNLAEHCDYNALADTVDKKNMTQLSAGKEVFGVVGDALFSPSSYLCVYYNKTLANSLGLENFYDTVENGEWTLGKMKECQTAISTLGEGYYCIGSNVDDEQLFNALFTASGMKYMNAGLGSVPSIVEYDTKTDTLIAELKTLMQGGSLYCKDGDADKKALFDEGKTLFYIGSVAELETLKGNFGILPLPKLDGEQNGYYTYVTDDAPVMCVLNTSSDVKKSVNIINGYNDASAVLWDGYVRDFLDFYARDGRSADMLTKIVEGITFDFATVIHTQFENVSYATKTAFTQSVLGNRNMQWYYNKYAFQANYNMNREFPIE